VPGDGKPIFGVARALPCDAGEVYQRPIDHNVATKPEELVKQQGKRLFSMSWRPSWTVAGEIRDRVASAV
jgi:hypothetical protein